jgi:HSP20 family molecular chaperone IbpA
MRENHMTVMKSWDLFEDLLAAQDDMLAMARGHTWRAGKQYDRSATARAWVPAVDISERKDAYLVATDLPGVKAGDVEITFEDGVLQILVPTAQEVQAKRIQVRTGQPHTALTSGAAAKNGS